MSVDQLRSEAKDYARGSILEIEKFLLYIKDKVESLELTDTARRDLNFAYHRCWSFRENLIKKYYFEGDVFTNLQAHLFKEHKLSSEQDVKLLSKNDLEFKNSIVIPSSLKKLSEDTLNFLDKTTKHQTTNDKLLHLEQNGDFWYINKDENCYQARGKQLDVLRFLIDYKETVTPKDLMRELDIKQQQQAINKVNLLIQKIAQGTGLDDVIIKGEDGNGYRISQKYKIVYKTH